MSTSTRAKTIKPATHAVSTAKPSPALPAPAAAAPATTAAATPLFIAPPPATANIPSVPDGFVPTNGTNYRGTQPRVSELVALPLALLDLRRFVNYAAIIGTTAPALAELIEAFDVTNAWSTMRNASSAWDGYSRDQEGIAWAAMRAMMDRLKPAFELAVKSNPSLATTYAGLASLLGAKTVSAQKGAATKKANKQDIAEGKTPTHGQVGKTRLKAAAKAALAAQNAKLGTQPSAPVVAPVVASPIALPPVVASPAVQPVAPAGAAPVNAGSGGSSGTPHA